MSITHAPRQTRSPARNLGPLIRHAPPWWPLAVILLAQTALSLRLIWSNTAFEDEALYLWAGHLELNHWIHGNPVPQFQLFFSGAPVVYPPLGALADSAGGLAGARLLGLAFMLGATTLLWNVTSRLYGARAAFFAAALFVSVGGTQFLGAFATYDPTAIFLLALSAWLVVRSEGKRSEVFLVAGGLVLALAATTKYVSVLWSPVIIAMAALTVDTGTVPRRLLRSLRVTAYAAVPLTLLLLKVGGKTYVKGLMDTTFNRSMGADLPASSLAIVRNAASWLGLLLVVCVVGVIVSFRTSVRERLLAITLAAAITFDPIQQLRIQVMTSMHKHVVFGAWFAAIIGGYGLAAVSRVERGRIVAGALAVPIALFTVFSSTAMASSTYSHWRNVTAEIPLLRSAMDKHPGNVLVVGSSNVEAYYLAKDFPWEEWHTTDHFVYYSPQGTPYPGNQSYTEALKHYYFSVVVTGTTNDATDRAIQKDLKAQGNYYVTTRIGKFAIWTFTPLTARKGG